jgi:cell division protein YceG involved in septum cleavage
MEKKRKKSGWSYVLVLVITIAFFATNVYMDYKNKAYASNEFVQVEVNYGDTIWDFSKIYKEQHDLSTKEFIKRVEKLNNMDANHLEEGQIILLPITKNS